MRGKELAERLRFDYRILTDMRCKTFDFTAYRTNWDLTGRRNAISPSDDTSLARKYHFVLNVPTLISATEMVPTTEMSVDVEVADYPEMTPTVYVLSKHVPWSPHFRAGDPVCIGSEAWEARHGHVVLGELVVHLQHLLNWDEKGRGSGYDGFNRAAIRHHRDVLHGKPLDEGIIYAQLPHWLTVREPEPGFNVTRRGRMSG